LLYFQKVLNYRSNDVNCIMRDRNRTDHFIWLEHQNTKKDFKDKTIDNEQQYLKDNTIDNGKQNTNSFGKQSETDFKKDHHRFLTTNERR
jgi:hypothetical protein